MNVPDSRGDTILLADDDGNVTILEPLEDPFADETPEQRQAMLDYLKRMRKHYRPDSRPPQTPPSSHTP